MSIHDPAGPSLSAPGAAAPWSEPAPPLPVAEPAPAALKVSSSSRPAAVAGAIAGMVRERGHVELQAIGAGAINQAVKAIALARGYLAPERVDLVCIPSFVDVVVNEAERTAIRFVVEPR
jgi:stage V sporulation protein S